MELFSVTIALLAGFPLNLMAVTATSFLIPLNKELYLMMEFCIGMGKMDQVYG